MHQKDKQQVGFGIIESIIIATLALGLIGFVAWRFVEANGTEDVTRREEGSSDATSSRDQVADSYAGWKSYTASVKKYTFKYPAGWMVSQQNSEDVEAVTLTAPQRTIDGSNYSFSLMFRIFKPLGVDRNQYHIFKTNRVNSGSLSHELYSVISGAADPIGSSSHGKAGFIYAATTNFPTGQLENKDITISMDANTGQEIELYGSFIKVDSNVLSYFDPAKFENLEDVQIAIKIFGSLSDK